MKNYKWYKIALLKAYFDKGYSITSYPKWVIATVGIGSAIQGSSLWWIIGGGFLYGVSCLILGKILYKKGFVWAETEVNNQYNPFCHEVRLEIFKNGELKGGKKCQK